MRYHFCVIRIIKTLEAFDSLHSDWDSFARFPQQSFAWCRAGWDYFRAHNPNARLFIIVSYDEPNTIHLILPTCLDASGTLRFILDTFSDHCDVLVKAGTNRSRVLQTVYKAIREASDVRFVRLRRLPADSILLHHFGAVSDGTVLFREGASLFLDIPRATDIEAALPHLYSRERDKLHRQLRQLSEYTFNIHAHCSGDPFPRERLKSLTAEMVAQGLRTPDFFTDSFLDFAEALYHSGLCEISELHSADAGEAMNLNLCFNRTTLLWMILYTNRRLPSLMGLACVRQLASVGASRLDFGAGVYAYKSEALRPQSEIAFTLCFGKGLGGWLRAGCAMLWRQLKDGVKTWKRGQ